MKEGFSIFLLLCLQVTYYSTVSGNILRRNMLAPGISPSLEPQPFLPLLAPSPLMPFTNGTVPITNGTVPILSGLCPLNFTAAESVMSTAATDCWAYFAPYSANVVCCPQFDATLVILMGQFSKYSGVLALNTTHSKHCLSDVVMILEARGANGGLQNICSIHPVNLTAASCPIIDATEFESSVDTTRLLNACEKINPVKECCSQVCQNVILDSARKISLNGMAGFVGDHSPEHSSRIDDCKKVVLRWLASKLDPSSANVVLRGLSNCHLNKVCPLDFPDISKVGKECMEPLTNQTACCKAMESYVSRLQGQSFLTNLQALNCAGRLGIKLQKANVSKNLYDLCHINLKDFSLQVQSQESGCLLPSLPSDATYDNVSGVSFICDLNDNIAAPWPSSSLVPLSSCNKTGKLPALPSVTSANLVQRGLHLENLIFPLIVSSLIFLKMPY